MYRPINVGVDKLLQVYPKSAALRGGELSVRHVADVLLDMPSIPLSRIQAVTLISQANIVDGAINVHRFIPGTDN